MNRSNTVETIKVESIFHPSDFSHASDIAFAHALKIVTKGALPTFELAGRVFAGLKGCFTLVDWLQAAGAK
jgi:hypothetical protein